MPTSKLYAYGIEEKETGEIKSFFNTRISARTAMQILKDAKLDKGYRIVVLELRKTKKKA